MTLFSFLHTLLWTVPYYFTTQELHMRIYQDRSWCNWDPGPHLGPVHTPWWILLNQLGLRRASKVVSSTDSIGFDEGNFGSKYWVLFVLLWRKFTFPYNPSVAKKIQTLVTITVGKIGDRINLFKNFIKPDLRFFIS